MNLAKSQFDATPELIEREGKNIRINFGVEEIEISNIGEGKEKEIVTKRKAYAAYIIRIPQPIGYDTIVNAIISAAYPADKMQAIINNHLLESDNTEHEQEFAEMQEWRKTAKSVAKEAMAYYIEHFN
mgnify:CR=1 FL=1|nr:MAG TPA: hypothetical protein [Caudoviricetes sp.]